MAEHEQLAVRTPSSSIIVSLSERWGVSPENLARVVKSTIFRGEAAKATNDELVAFLQVCDRFSLNPFIREIYAFVGKSGGVFPIVGIDGWVNLVNHNPKFDGVEFIDTLDEKGKMVSVTCAMTIKDRALPTKITEYMEECMRDTEPWRKWPRRMLRHKAYIQCARYAFGYSGIYEEDEVERIQEAMHGTRGPILVQTGEGDGRAPATSLADVMQDRTEPEPVDPPVETEKVELPKEEPKQTIHTPPADDKPPVKLDEQKPAQTEKPAADKTGNGTQSKSDLIGEINKLCKQKNVQLGEINAWCRQEKNYGQEIVKLSVLQLQTVKIKLSTLEAGKKFGAE